MADRRAGLASDIAKAGPLRLANDIDQVDLFDGDPAAGSPIEGTARALGLGGQIAPHRRGPGRRPGSRNATTLDVLRFLSSRYRHPLLGLADIASMDWRNLAELLVPEPQGGPDDDEKGGSEPTRERVRDELEGLKASRITREDVWRAAQLQVKCAELLAEYMVPKQPRMVTVTADSAPLMHFDLTTDQLAGSRLGAAIDQVFGLTESQAKSMASATRGPEVLDAEVLEPTISPEKSNG